MSIMIPNKEKPWLFDFCRCGEIKQIRSKVCNGCKGKNIHKGRLCRLKNMNEK